MDRSAIGLGGVFLRLRRELNWSRLFQGLIEDFDSAGIGGSATGCDRRGGCSTSRLTMDPAVVSGYHDGTDKLWERGTQGMNDMVAAPQFDRTVEDLGNIVELGHVNVTVPDQTLATAYYLMGLGLTRDPYLMAGLENMWGQCRQGPVPFADTKCSGGA